MASPIQKAVTAAGGQVALAKAIRDWHLREGRAVKVSQAHVWAWINISKTPAPPAEHCRAIEEIVNGAVSRYDLRPDVFGDAVNEQASEA